MFIFCLVLVAVVGLLVAKDLVAWCVKEDAVVMKRRTAAAKAAPLLIARGYKRIGALAQAYSIGNYKEFAKDLDADFKLLTNDDGHLLTELDAAGEAWFFDKLSTPDGRSYVAAHLGGAEAPHTAVPPTA